MQARIPRDPPAVVVMGVSASGKTTIGRALADRLGITFIDGDDHHPPENIEKMRAGRPLDDYDRARWLITLAWEFARHTNPEYFPRIQSLHPERRPGAVLACSALKAEYRRILRASSKNALLVHLAIDQKTAAARIAARKDHFIPASHADSPFLDSQFADLEEPTPDEALILDATQTPDAIVDTIIGMLNAS